MSQPSRTLPTFEAILAEERSRTGRQLNAIRLLVLTPIVALMLGVHWHTPDWIAPAPALLVLWWMLAVTLFWAGRYRVRGWWLAALGVGAIDMPMLFVSLRDTIDHLQRAGYAADASRLGFAATAYYAAAVVGSAQSLDERFVAATTVGAAVFQVLLMRAGGIELSLLAIALTVTLSIGVGSAYQVRRTRALLVSVASEHARRERLGGYFSPQVLAQVEAGVVGQRPETRDVSVLFSDLRDFTAFAEQLSSEALVAMLDEYHEHMVQVVFDFDGMLDKYLGDGMMVVFGAPVRRRDHAELAVRCALRMQDELGRLNATRAARGEPPLRMGIGIHSGPVVVGDVGARQRREYTAIGDTVNVAARMQELTRVHGVPVLVSDDTVRQLDGRLAVDPVGEVRVRGRTQPLGLHAPQAAPSAPTRADGALGG